ncbi:MAG: Macrolide export ATP-binding protein MacB [candidate division WS6 bacterium OLB20]|uniref:Macrolide export ATP-binding protein MacB n=1 Tax=candidate division WS6 bacterium OLB20 TaxID=1617426 RepID=A0A136LXU2_9BACT|nr:MAG: Macrolide export ATP-binding protein MacB [candidate division WS6 bacterium OLB20]
MQAVLQQHPTTTAPASQTGQSGTLLELAGITKIYNAGQENAFQALKGIDLVIEKGEFVAIMGPSGSGKSTLMNILGALDVPSSGTYTLRGVNVEGLSENQLAEFRNQDVGFVFQRFNLLPRLSVMENVLLPALYGDLPDAEARALQLLGQVGLESKSANMPNQLSGGEMQRIAIARALIMQPSIIMADEPTGNLDTKTSEEIMSLFREIHEQGNTVILITHEDDIAANARRVINIRDGRVVP